jgi:pimeloyl-ACP methyl ester carboxylesterase
MSSSALSSSSDRFAASVDQLYEAQKIQSLDGGGLVPVLKDPSESRDHLPPVDGMQFWVQDMDPDNAITPRPHDADAADIHSPRVLRFAHERHARKVPDIVYLTFPGYGQVPSGYATEKFMRSAQPFFEQHNIHGIGFANGSRGRPEVITRRGRWTVADILEWVTLELDAVLETLREENSQVKFVLDGHSQGGQIVGHILAHPERFGFDPGDIIGAVLRNSVALPHSQSSLLTPGILPLLARATPSVVKSLLTRRGVTVSDQLAYDFFIGEGDIHGENERRILDRIYPVEGAYFLQSLTTGSSPSFINGQLHGLPVSLVSSSDDQLMGMDGQLAMAEHFQRRGGADTSHFEIPGRHFSGLLTYTGEDSTRIDSIVKTNQQAMAHALRDLP